MSTSFSDKLGGKSVAKQVAGVKPAAILDANSLSINVDALHAFMTNLMDVLHSKLDMTHEVDKDFVDVMANIRAVVALAPKLMQTADLSSLITDPSVILDMGSVKGSFIGQDFRILWDFLQHGYRSMASDSSVQSMTWLFSTIQTLRATTTDRSIAERCAKQLGQHGPSFVAALKAARDSGGKPGTDQPSKQTWQSKLNG